ncbi:hypothetical protein [Halorubrum lipolyticum]|uniref:Uncharacterized protein n=1 Tax=Halorubrum lipolyticum DSM 21995 TaxID=1227482 RepID=M0NVF8_9EURY|nr:hypothetical protein [Halorubrum lipolyticum]EMA61801.1 hypothetical protein C469_06414 [Halorubrum lipolyticum DSM 21995]
MSDSRTPKTGSAGTDDDPERPPRYEQVIRWAEYIKEHPPEVWGPQQNAVVNGQIESAKAVDVSAEDRERIREFARAELGEETDSETDDPERSDPE